MIRNKVRAGTSENVAETKSVFPIRKRSGAVSAASDEGKKRRLGSHATEKVVIEHGRLKKLELA